MAKLWLVSAAIFGFLSVALGAFGAHSLKNILDEYGKAIYEKAVIYQMFHAMALFAVGLLQHLVKLPGNRPGLPGKETLFHIVPLDPAYKAGLAGHVPAKNTSFSPAGWGFFVGILLFSGSLYLLAITGIKWFGAITPIGGVAFLFGWVWFSFSMIKARI